MGPISKKHNFSTLLLAGAFPLSLYIFAYPTPIFRFMIASFVLFLTVALSYLWLVVYLEGITSWLWQAVLLTLYYLSWAVLFFLAPNKPLQIILLLGSIPITFFMQRFVLQVSEYLMYNRIIIVGAAFFLGISGAANFYFKLPGALYLGVVFLFITFLARAGFEYTPLPAIAKLTNALILGLLTTEVFWASSFLPFHYSVLALISFNCFYILWQLDYAYIFHTLTFKKTSFLIGLGVVTILLVLLVTPWSVIS